MIIHFSHIILPLFDLTIENSGLDMIGKKVILAWNDMRVSKLHNFHFLMCSASISLSVGETFV